MKRFLVWSLGIVVVFVAVLVALSFRSVPERVEYGVTFSVPYAKEIGLDWKEAYRATLVDLGVKHIRVPVYWSLVERARGLYDWRDIDFQVEEARARGATVILAIGRRVPRWPECHIPEWAKGLTWEEEKEEVRAYIRATVERYKNNSAVTMWQVENEPYLRFFADTYCGVLDENFLDEEIALVKSLDARPILITDSGNLGYWTSAYRRADVFGTSVYLYFWNDAVGAFRTILPSAYYRVKANLMRMFFGVRPIIVSELSLEPWLGVSIRDVPLQEQLERMSIDKFYEIIAYAQETSFGMQYLWGVEWWYYMKTKQNHPEFWEAGKALFVD